MKFTIDEVACIDCGACRRHCPVDCIPYEMMQHRVDLSRCIGCTICYAVCPADAVLPVPDGRAAPDLSWGAMERVRTHVFRRGPRHASGRDLARIGGIEPMVRSDQPAGVTRCAGKS